MCDISHEEIIPHDGIVPDDDPPLFVYRLDYPKHRSQTLNTFHPPLATKLPNAPPDAFQTPKPYWQVVAAKIHDLHARFAAHNAIIGNPRCSGPDRRAVLLLYREALAKLEHTTPLIARKIHLEAVTKVSTILDLRVAEPDDGVFYAKDAFLSPLEPQYAAPRLEFYDRENGEGDDGYFWTGYGRLWEWRREGWPRVVPWKAIERERRAREKRRRKGWDMLREPVSEGMMKAYETDAMDWGNEVDADPGRPWA
ncbi:hypothetical protein SVAN01_04000 [Stagonosporopsis vannaccii]|nr:hypothetical protein SVAN01_04000 [Stagonosporopsis vannaccii]